MGNSLISKLDSVEEIEEILTKIFFNLDVNPRKDHLDHDDLLYVIFPDVKNPNEEIRDIIKMSGYHSSNTLSLDEFIYAMRMKYLCHGEDGIERLRKILCKTTQIRKSIKERSNILTITVWKSAPCSLLGSDVYVYIRNPGITPRDSIGGRNAFITPGENIVLERVRNGAIIHPSDIKIIPFCWEEYDKISLSSRNERIFVVGYNIPFVLQNDNIVRIDTKSLTQSRYRQRYKKFGLKGVFKAPENITLYASLDITVLHVEITPDEKGIRSIILIK